MMKTTFIKCLFIVILICTVYSASAKTDSVKQYRDFKNTVILSNSYFYFPRGSGNTWRFEFIFPSGNYGDQFNIYYERKIYRSWRAGFGYATWNLVPALIENTYPGGATVLASPNSGKIGEVEFRRAYKMYDVYADYKYNYFKKHKIMVGIGASYTWGINTVVDSIISFQGSFDGYVIRHEQKGHYYGLLGSLRYDYMMIRDRVGVGINVNYRKYLHLYYDQVEYGMHLNFNF